MSWSYSSSSLALTNWTLTSPHSTSISPLPYQRLLLLLLLHASPAILLQLLPLPVPATSTSPSSTSNHHSIHSIQWSFISYQRNRKRRKKITSPPRHPHLWQVGLLPAPIVLSIVIMSPEDRNRKKKTIREYSQWICFDICMYCSNPIISASAWAWKPSNAWGSLVVILTSFSHLSLSLLLPDSIRVA